MFKLEIYSGQKRKPAKDANKVKHVSSDLQVKLDELRKEISSSHGGIFPHAVLSTQQISLLSAKKCLSMEEVMAIYLLQLANCYQFFIFSKLCIVHVLFWPSWRG